MFLADVLVQHARAHTRRQRRFLLQSLLVRLVEKIHCHKPIIARIGALRETRRSTRYWILFSAETEGD
jgi:hypothetical protein